MNLTKEEMLELAKKCGAKVVYVGAQHTIFFESQLDLSAYTSAIEQKYRAQISNAESACMTLRRELTSLQKAAADVCDMVDYQLVESGQWERLGEATDSAEYFLLAGEQYTDTLIAEIEAGVLRADSPLQKLIAAHAEMLEANPYCYFELAYTRRTEWMAWLCSKPQEDDPGRIVLAKGQGSTPEEAAIDALEFMAAEKRKQAEQGKESGK